MNLNDLKKANTLRKQLLDAATAIATLPPRADVLEAARDEPFTVVVLIQTENGGHSAPIPLSRVGEYYDTALSYLRARQLSIRDELVELGVSVSDKELADLIAPRVQECMDDTLLQRLGVSTESQAKH